MYNSVYASSPLFMDSLKYFTYSETRRAFPLGFPLLQNSSAYHKHFQINYESFIQSVNNIELVNLTLSLMIRYEMPSKLSKNTNRISGKISSFQGRKLYKAWPIVDCGYDSIDK